MAGHSKWSNIKHRKGKQDAARAKVFNKLGREIYVAAKLGGGDPDMNPRLRTAVAAAKAENMPNDRIAKAIDKAVGGGEGEDYEEVRYEGYGPGGVAIIIDALTDNRNRTVAEIRSCFTKYGGSLGETGAVNFMFDRIGQIVYPLAKDGPDKMFEAAAEAGASDCESDEEFHEISCDPDDFSTVRDALEKKYGEAEKAGLAWRPNVMGESTEEQAESLLKLVDALEDNDDVQVVTTNLDLSDEIMEKLMAAG